MSNLFEYWLEKQAEDFEMMEKEAGGLNKIKSMISKYRPAKKKSMLSRIENIGEKIHNNSGKIGALAGGAKGFKDGAIPREFGDIFSTPMGDEYIRLGWAKCTETGECGERVVGAQKLQVGNITKSTGIK